jgi:hypothetical protein
MCDLLRQVRGNRFRVDRERDAIDAHKASAAPARNRRCPPSIMWHASVNGLPAKPSSGTCRQRALDRSHGVDTYASRAGSGTVRRAIAPSSLSGLGNGPSRRRIQAQALASGTVRMSERYCRVGGSAAVARDLGRERGVGAQLQSCRRAARRCIPKIPPRLPHQPHGSVGSWLAAQRTKQGVVL